MDNNVSLYASLVCVVIPILTGNLAVFNLLDAKNMAADILRADSIYRQLIRRMSWGFVLWVEGKLFAACASAMAVK